MRSWVQDSLGVYVCNLSIKKKDGSYSLNMPVWSLRNLVGGFILFLLEYGLSGYV